MQQGRLCGDLWYEMQPNVRRNSVPRQSHQLHSLTGGLLISLRSISYHENGPRFVLVLAKFAEFDWEMTHLILNSQSRARRWCWRNAKRRWLEEPTSCQHPHWAIQGGGCIIIKSVAGKKNSRLYRMSKKSDYWWLSPCPVTRAAL